MNIILLKTHLYSYTYEWIYNVLTTQGWNSCGFQNYFISPVME